MTDCASPTRQLPAFLLSIIALVAALAALVLNIRDGRSLPVSGPPHAIPLLEPHGAPSAIERGQKSAAAAHQVEAVPLAKAMKLAAVEAASTLEADRDSEHWHLINEQYLELLSDGVPIAACRNDLERRITAIFASHLTDHHREEWLSEALQGACAPKRPEFLGALKRHGPIKKEIAEAVFNLSCNPHRRLEALHLWERQEQRKYEDALAVRSRAMLDPDLVRLGRHPRKGAMPRWNVSECGTFEAESK